jgi:hypothetical protein
MDKMCVHFLFFKEEQLHCNYSATLKQVCKEMLTCVDSVLSACVKRYLGSPGDQNNSVFRVLVHLWTSQAQYICVGIMPKNFSSMSYTCTLRKGGGGVML